VVVAALNVALGPLWVTTCARFGRVTDIDKGLTLGVQWWLRLEAWRLAPCGLPAVQGLERSTGLVRLNVYVGLQMLYRTLELAWAPWYSFRLTGFDQS